MSQCYISGLWTIRFHPNNLKYKFGGKCSSRFFRRKILPPITRASQRSRSEAFGRRHLSCRRGGMSHALPSDLGCYKVHHVTQKYLQCFANPPKSFKKPGEFNLHLIPKDAFQGGNRRIIREWSRSPVGAGH